MFTPKTDRLAKLATKYPKQIEELERLFATPTNIYIDYANVLGWRPKLGWHIDTKRLKQLLDSFDGVRSVKLYYGTLVGDPKSELFMKELEKFGYDRRTKPVKTLRLPIDVSSVAANSPDILKNFIRKPLLDKFKVQTVEYLNNELRDLNLQGIYVIEDRKCNFDVEIGRDLVLDVLKDEGLNHVILWSGDSDFADSLSHLMAEGKKASLFATAKRVSTELNDLRAQGLYVFDIQKIKEFICQAKEMQQRL